MLNDFVVKPEVASEARYNLVTRRPNVKLPGVPYRAFRPRRVSVLFGYGPVHTVGMRNANPNRNRHSDPFLSRGSLPLPKVEAKDKRSDFDRHEARHVPIEVATLRASMERILLGGSQSGSSLLSISCLFLFVVAVNPGPSTDFL